MAIFIPIYPVFGAVLYDGSNRNILNPDINQATIITSIDNKNGDNSYITSEGTVASKRQTIITYWVKPGDTLSSIAAEFQLTLDTIRWSNKLTSDTLKPDQQLLISPDNGLIYTARTGDTLSSIAQKYQIPLSKIQTQNNIGDILSVGEQIFLPGAEQPKDIPAPIKKPGNTNTSVEKFVLKVVNPK